ncbi:metal-dependent hydrolase [Methyloligella sp. 2.7D]|uniref:metal-dependent hydrolase n=1 Tax=unclassified Methyloligella TaxID=2625955 RepID=UPI00157CE67C|nr:metal-dependent hydrolase [Methyloligella sp. GL2]QKP77430.1 metal-dependent hydrolase [Methyloligella sp. GL2]
MKITWFGHSCFRIDLEESHILIDPFLTGNGVFEAANIPVSEVAKGITHLALTHGHDDHTGDTVSILKESNVPLIAVFELAAYMQGQGVETAEYVNTGGTLQFEDFSISYVPAWHSSSTIVDGKPLYLGACCGIVITPKNGKTVYHMGDTDIFADMALINEMYAPEVGIVPIGDRFTMGAKSASLACKTYFGFETVFPCHYGTFPIIDQTPDKFVSEMEGQNVVVPKVGEPVEI